MAKLEVLHVYVCRVGFIYFSVFLHEWTSRWSNFLPSIEQELGSLLNRFYEHITFELGSSQGESATMNDIYILWFMVFYMMCWLGKRKWVFFSREGKDRRVLFYKFILSNFRHLRIKSRFDDNAEYRINGSMVWGLQVLHTFVSLASHYRLRAWELFTVVHYPVSVRRGAPFCRRVEIVCSQIVFICWSRDRERNETHIIVERFIFYQIKG